MFLMFRDIGMTYYSSLEEAFPKKRTIKESNDSDHFVSNSKRQPRQDMLGERERVSYRSQLSDYDYVCKTTGVCPLEEFTVKEAQKKCEPIQPPKYEYPFNDQDKDKFRKALKIALEQMEDGPNPKSDFLPPPPALQKTPNYEKPIPKNDITGIFDEELENYLKVKDFQTIPTDKPSIPAERLRDPSGKEENVGTYAPFPEKAFQSPPTKSASVMPPPASPLFEKEKPASFTKQNKIWMNLLLFISGGILFIFLLEQLYRLAIYNGLKKTVESLEYIIKEAKETSSS
jgi:hypothetical protein